jgi:hypothetical protein
VFEEMKARGEIQKQFKFKRLSADGLGCPIMNFFFQTPERLREIERGFIHSFGSSLQFSQLLAPAVQCRLPVGVVGWLCDADWPDW